LFSSATSLFYSERDEAVSVLKILLLMDFAGVSAAANAEARP
jgi:hypothetical protein